MTDSERIEQLRTLLSIVVDNTKREMRGKPTSGRETRMTASVLTTLLRRAPVLEEVELAQQY